MNKFEKKIICKFTITKIYHTFIASYSLIIKEHGVHYYFNFYLDCRCDPKEMSLFEGSWWIVQTQKQKWN